MKKNKIVSATLAFALLGTISTWQGCSCNKVKIGCGGPMTGNEPTAIMLIFRNINNPADIDTSLSNSGQSSITLSANSSYHVQVLFLNQRAIPSSAGYDMTPSVVKESSSYLVCFNDSATFYGNQSANLNWIREDMDNSASPMQLGVVDSFWTGADSVCGLLQTTLHHQYKLKNGDCDPGYVDIQALDTIYISPARNAQYH